MRSPSEWYRVEQVLAERLPGAAAGAAGRVGAVGVRRGAGGQRLPGGGGGGAAGAGRRWRRAAPAAARVAATTGRTRRRPARPSWRWRPASRRCCAGCWPGGGATRWRWRSTPPPWATGRGAGGERALPRLRDPGRLARPAGQPRGAWLPPSCGCSAAGAGGAGRVDGARAGRPRAVEPTGCGRASARSGWHPLLRVKGGDLRPGGRRRAARRALVPGRGTPGSGAGVAFRDRAIRRAGDLLVVWAAGQKEPWAAADRPGARAGSGVCWYGLRTWIELGFRALKGVGWQWQRTRRDRPRRVGAPLAGAGGGDAVGARLGTRAEDAAGRGGPAARLRTPAPAARPPTPPAPSASSPAACSPPALAAARRPALAPALARPRALAAPAPRPPHHPRGGLTRADPPYLPQSALPGGEGRVRA